jgi:hypothetical protein
MQALIRPESLCVFFSFFFAIPSSSPSDAVEKHNSIAKGRKIPRQALPVRKNDIEYYSNPEKRGYLVEMKREFESQLAKEGGAVEQPATP